MTTPNAVTSPLKAPRAKCLDCCCHQTNEVKLCSAKACPLHPFRFGKNPYLKGRTMTEEERAAATARLNAIRPKRTDATG